MRHPTASILAFTLALIAGVFSRPLVADAAERRVSVLADGVHHTHLGDLRLRLVRDRSGDLRGRLTLLDTTQGTDVVGIIRGDTLRLRGTFRGEPVRETAALRDLLNLDLADRAPKMHAPKLTCPGKIGKLICAVAELIIAACVEDGEIFGLKCSDAPDGGGTSGGSDSGSDGGTSTAG